VSAFLSRIWDVKVSTLPSGKWWYCMVWFTTVPYKFIIHNHPSIWRCITYAVEKIILYNLMNDKLSNINLFSALNHISGSHCLTFAFVSSFYRLLFHRPCRMDSLKVVGLSGTITGLHVCCTEITSEIVPEIFAACHTSTRKESENPAGSRTTPEAKSFR
jgi:hypothetical protein